MLILMEISIDYFLMVLFFWCVAGQEPKNRWGHRLVVGLLWPLIFLALVVSPIFEKKEQ